MDSDETKTGWYDAIDFELNDEDLLKLMVGRAIYDAHQEILIERPEPTSMAAFMGEIANEFPVHSKREFQRRYRIYEKLVSGTAPELEMPADFHSRLMTRAAEIRYKESDFLRRVLKHVYIDLLQGKSNQHLKDHLNEAIEIGYSTGLFQPYDFY